MTSDGQQLTRERRSVIDAALALSTEFLSDPDLAAASRKTLQHAEELTGSQYGFLGVRHRGGRIRILAISEAAWDLVGGWRGHGNQQEEFARRGFLEFPWFTQLLEATMPDKQPLIVNDASAHVVSSMMEEGHPLVRRFIAAPMVASNRVNGIIVLANKAAPYDESDLRTLEVFASKVAVFEEHDRLSRTLERRADFAQALAQAGATMARAEDPPSLHRAACRAVTDGLEYAMATLVIRRPDGTVEHSITEGADGHDVARVFAVASNECGGCSLSSRVLDGGEHVLLGDLDQEELGIPCRRELLEICVRSLLALPVPLRRAGTAALVVGASAPHGFPPEVIPLLETFARQLGEMWQNTILREDLVEARDHAELAARTKASILANVTHELRTPLTAVIGFANLLRKETAGPLVERQRGYVKHIVDSGEYLLELVNRVIELARGGDQGIPVDRRMVDVTAVVGRAAMTIRARWPDAQIEMVESLPEGLPPALGDQRALSLVIEALLTNAFKFTPDGGRIEITARTVEGQLEIAVSDTGCGISAADQQRIFEAFEKAPSGFARREAGVGLGLSQARFLLRTMDGEISVRSQIGAGSTFTIKMPRTDATR